MTDARPLFWCSAWTLTLGITFVSPPVGAVTGVLVLFCQWRSRRRA